MFSSYFTDPLVVGDHYVRPLDVIASVLGAFCGVIGNSSCFHLSFVQAHVGYLHLVSACFRCSSSFLNSSGVEQMVFALCCSESTILYLDETVWLLSHWRYRSVCVGFLYTVVFRLPSSSGIIRISKKSMEPSSPASSLVNWMCSSMLFRCSRKLVFWDDWRMVKVSSTNLLQKRIWYGRC